MTNRLIDLDDTLLEQARGVLRTRTMKDTVNQALGEVVRAGLRRRHADRLVRMDGLEIDDPEVTAGAWRS
ncbi:MAG: type II toxin-antitoxin system VapB family antitoxin [Actinomycetota bacterium]|nr:type II toxin-antitoxin system VapB family antitoxin [Actinomycetota bacterium]